ncbi:MAG: rhodanese-like domain-containing protein [Vicinamibacterales bacterium]
MTLRPTIGVVLVAAAATLADFVWYSAGVRHSVTAGLVHGALLLSAVGAVIGAASGRTLKGLPIGFLAGIGGALAYYILVAFIDPRIYGTAIPGAWVVMWFLLAALEGRWLRAPRQRSWAQIAWRGSVAAMLGGLAFVLVRHLLWGRPADADRSYLLQFATWTFAWAPGLLSLMWGRADEAELVQPADLAARIERGEALRILDVRSTREFRAGHVPGAVNIPFQDIGARGAKIPGGVDEPLYLYCGHGPRAFIAAALLRRRGRSRFVYLRGHWAGWRRLGGRVETGDGSEPGRGRASGNGVA